MVHSIPNATVQPDSGWPKVWPPVQLPPPSPLDAAASSLWSPKLSAPTAGANPQADPLYSAQLPQGGPPADGPGRPQMAFLDQRIALMRWDASHSPGAGAAGPAGSLAA